MRTCDARTHKKKPIHIRGIGRMWKKEKKMYFINTCPYTSLFSFLKHTHGLVYRSITPSSYLCDITNHNIIWCFSSPDLYMLPYKENTANYACVSMCNVDATSSVTIFLRVHFFRAYYIFFDISAKRTPHWQGLTRPKYLTTVLK